MHIYSIHTSQMQTSAAYHGPHTGEQHLVGSSGFVRSDLQAQSEWSGLRRDRPLCDVIARYMDSVMLRTVYYIMNLHGSV